MYRTLSNLVPKDKDLPERAWQMDVFTRFLTGKIYDLQPHEFHEEFTDAREYIPIAKRAPSVRYALLSVVVKDSVSFLFSEGRWPSIDVEGLGSDDDAKADEAAEEVFAGIIKDCRLNEVMTEAAQKGSVGSIVVWVRVLDNRLFFKTMATTYLTPVWKATAPDTLERVVEQYKVKGRTLRAAGRNISKDDDAVDFWFRREWDETREIWFVPRKVLDGEPDTIDAANTVVHGLGFVPMVWIKNLPGGDDIDGLCTFELAIPNAVEIDYQLSQAGRGLKYSSAPTLLIKDDGNLPGNRTHIVGDALIVPPEGDAKLLEISGTAATAVIEYVREVRKLALESVGGSRADSDKLSAATSGRALELMNQALINLADQLRTTYGEGGLLKLLKMVAALTRKFSLKDSDGTPIKPVPEDAKIKLVWPRWYAPTAEDRQQDATALTTLTSGGILSKETAVNALASDYDIENVDEEVKKIEADTKADLDRQMTLKPPAAPKPPGE